MLQHYGLIYKATNLINGKLYIGQTTQIQEYLKGKYTGSGSAFKKAKRKYGRKNFKFEILQYIELKGLDKDLQIQLDNLETHYIKRFDTLVPNGYNLIEGGRGGKKHSITKEKIAKANLKENISLETIQKRVNTRKLNNSYSRLHTEETKKKISEKLKGRTGVIPSQETRLKMSEAKKGKTISEEHKKAIGLKSLGNKHSLGRKLTQEHKEKLLASRKGIPHSEETKRKIKETKAKNKTVFNQVFYKEMNL